MQEQAMAAVARAGEEEDPLLFADQVAELVGEITGEPIEARSVIFYASQSRRRDRDGVLTPYDLPVPRDEDYTLREVTTTAGETRRIRSPRWRKSAIVAWRKAMDERPAPARARDTSGRYQPRAS